MTRVLGKLGLVPSHAFDLLKPNLQVPLNEVRDALLSAGAGGAPCGAAGGRGGASLPKQGAVRREKAGGMDFPRSLSMRPPFRFKERRLSGKTNVGMKKAGILHSSIPRMGPRRFQHLGVAQKFKSETGTQVLVFGSICQGGHLGTLLEPQPHGAHLPKWSGFNLPKVEPVWKRICGLSCFGFGFPFGVPQRALSMKDTHMYCSIYSCSLVMKGGLPLWRGPFLSTPSVVLAKPLSIRTSFLFSVPQLPPLTIMHFPLISARSAAS